MFNLEFLAVIRAAELTEIEKALPAGAVRILEIGGGTGQQAKMLSERGFDIVSIDIGASNYHSNRVFPVIDYDGRTLPFADATFDVVLSSNVLEHVTDLATMHREMARVLRPGGIGVHTMPTHSWRFWTSVAHYANMAILLMQAIPRLFPRSLSPDSLILTPLRGVYAMGKILHGNALPLRHGERGNVVSEILYFHPQWWHREFLTNGYELLASISMGLFYTGYMVLGSRLGLDTRRRLSRILGSACHLYVVRRPATQGETRVRQV